MFVCVLLSVSLPLCVAADACPGHAPLVDPSFGASQVFVYHGAAVLQWRAFVGEEYFDGLAEKYGFTTDQFISTWTDIANMQVCVSTWNL